MISKSIITLHGVTYTVQPFTMLQELEYGLRLKKAIGSKFFPLFAAEAKQADLAEKGGKKRQDQHPDMPNPVELSLFLLSQSDTSKANIGPLLNKALTRCHQLTDEGAQPYALFSKNFSKEQTYRLATRACLRLSRNFFLEMDRFSQEVARLNAEDDDREMHGSQTTGPAPTPIPDGWECSAFLAAILEYAPLTYTDCLKLTLKELLELALASLVESRRRLASAPVHSDEWNYL